MIQSGLAVSSLEKLLDAVPLPPNTRYLLLAQATCADDRANIDPAAGLSCNQQAPLIDLVAGDNNLGLWVLAN